MTGKKFARDPDFRNSPTDESGSLRQKRASDPDTRWRWLLWHMQGMSYREIAKASGAALSTVGTVLNRLGVSYTKRPKTRWVHQQFDTPRMLRPILPERPRHAAEITEPGQARRSVRPPKFALRRALSPPRAA